MDHGDADAIDLLGPAFIDFTEDGMGELSFIAIQGSLDCRPEPRDGHEGVAFSWVGVDEFDPTSGRGWAVAKGSGLEGHLYIHQGMDSHFTAEPFLPED